MLILILQCIRMLVELDWYVQFCLVFTEVGDDVTNCPVCKNQPTAGCP